MKNIAIIPARGGSKGVPKKNIKQINGKPLIAYTIEQALNSEIFQKVFVNTDSKEIANISKTFGAEIPFIRPKELASDTATTLEVVKHAIKEYEKLIDFDTIFILQPTSPFRTKKDFFTAIKILRKADSLASYSVASEHPSRMKFIENNQVIDILKEPQSLRRQEMKKVFVRNGAIYALKKQIPFKLNTLLPKNHFPLIMNELASINIDTHFDMMIAELILTYRKNNII